MILTSLISLTLEPLDQYKEKANHIGSHYKAVLAKFIMQLILNYSKSLTDFQFPLENLKKRLHISYLKTDIKQQIKTLYHPIYF